MKLREIQRIKDIRTPEPVADAMVAAAVALERDLNLARLQRHVNANFRQVGLIFGRWC